MNLIEIKRSNWVVYVTALLAGLIFTAYAFYETANPGTGYDAGQSRFGFSSDEAMMYSLISLFFGVLLTICMVIFNFFVHRRLKKRVLVGE